MTTKFGLPIFLILLLGTTGCSNKTLSSKKSSEYTQDAISSRRDASLVSYGEQWDSREIKNGEFSMKFDYTIFGEMPEDGRALYISMHGGGGTTQELNDQQWSNQKKLYQPSEGVYFVPRSPTNSWNMWHQGYMDGFIETVIELAVIKEGVNPNKVYIMGYSAGGDGTYQLAPRLADLWAGAAMSAGHPGDAQMLNLRNLPFALYMGGLDKPFNRNGIARDWDKRFDELVENDKNGYIHDVIVYEEYGHWMHHADAVSMSWLPKFKRNAIPSKVVWIQDDVIRNRFYWIEATKDGLKQGDKVVARYDAELGEVHIEECTPASVVICLNDKMMNLNRPVKIFLKGEEIFNGDVSRVKSNIDADVVAMRDTDLIFPAKLLVSSEGKVTVIEQEPK